MTVLGAMFGLADAPAVSDPAPPPDSEDQVSVTYRITAVVRVNGELRTGTALQSVTARRNITFGASSLSPIIIRFVGEAVAIPVVDDEYLLVLMHGKTSIGQYEALMADPCGEYTYPRDGSRDARHYLAYLDALKGPCVIPPDRWPLMMAASSSPASKFREVSASNIANIFREDVEFVSLTYSPVDKDLEYRLQSILGWIIPMRERSLAITLDRDGLAMSIYPQDIERGSEVDGNL